MGTVTDWQKARAHKPLRNIMKNANIEFLETLKVIKIIKTAIW